MTASSPRKWVSVSVAEMCASISSDGDSSTSFSTFVMSRRIFLRVVT